jgi:hypothetical protein
LLIEEVLQMGIRYQRLLLPHCFCDASGQSGDFYFILPGARDLNRQVAFGIECLPA